MATREGEALDRMFAALADPTRRAMVERLAKGGRVAISELAAPFSMSLPAILKHVGVLTDAGLVSRVKVGRTVYCGLVSAPLGIALSWLGKYEGYKLPADDVVAPAASGKARRTSTARKATSGARASAGARKGRAPAAKPAAKPAKKAGRRAAAQTATRAKAQSVPPKGKAQRGKRAAAAASGAVKRGQQAHSGTQRRVQTKAQTARRRARR